jgi:hypothetical protein
MKFPYLRQRDRREYFLTGADFGEQDLRVQASHLLPEVSVEQPYGFDFRSMLTTRLKLWPM